jgi:hypothetical protein
MSGRGAGGKLLVMNIDAHTGAEHESLLAAQWAGYRHVHQSRTNLILHIATVPFFWAGTLAVLASPVLGVGAAIAGVVTMAVVMAIQGSGHGHEASAPAKFKGPADMAGRILAEQWFTFPRYVVTGGFARALRAPR